MVLSWFFLLFGISGVIAIALNYILEATNKLGKDHKLFSIVNFYGSFALLSYSIYNEVWLFAVLNGFLVAVGIYGLLKVYGKVS